MLAVDVDPRVPVAVAMAVLAEARRTGLSLEWIETVLADPRHWLAYLPRDEPRGEIVAYRTRETGAP